MKNDVLILKRIVLARTVTSLLTPYLWYNAPTMLPVGSIVGALYHKL
jgi:hypothetical protein